MTEPQSQAFIERIASDPSIYPHQLDFIGDRALLVNLPLEAQSQAVFLDQRVLTPQTQGVWAPWAQFAEAAQATAPDRLGYILHAGHCGSTLISRLVAAVSGARPMREPLPLRAFAEEAADEASGVSFFSAEERRKRIGVLEKMWARGGTVVKATSICNGLVDDLCAEAPVAFVYVRPEIFLALLLGGASTHLDLRSFAKMRMRRLNGWMAAPERLAFMSPGELAAMSWFVEILSIAAASRPVLAIDFDNFLKDPAPMLAELCRHLGWPAETAKVKTTLAGPIMRQYAKAPEHSYDASTRSQIIAEDSARFSAEIRRGMQWLERAAKKAPEGEKALDRFAGR